MRYAIRRQESIPRLGLGVDGDAENRVSGRLLARPAAGRKSERDKETAPTLSHLELSGF
jgi:hypothetical protein